MNGNLGWGLFAVAIVVILYMRFANTQSGKTGYNTPNSNPNEVTCELVDASGKTITITGDASDPQFVNMCRNQQPNQLVYLYGYPYRFRRFHGGGHDNGGNGGDGGNGGGNGMA